MAMLSTTKACLALLISKYLRVEKSVFLKVAGWLLKLYAARRTACTVIVYLLTIRSDAVLPSSATKKRQCLSAREYQCQLFNANSLKAFDINIEYQARQLQRRYASRVAPANTRRSYIPAGHGESSPTPAHLIMPTMRLIAIHSAMPGGIGHDDFSHSRLAPHALAPQVTRACFFIAR